MVVGMVTVFCILLIVIYLSKGLIAAVNKWAPEEANSSQNKAKQATPAVAVDNRTMAVIQAAVAQITGGKGRVKKVERI